MEPQDFPTRLQNKIKTTCGSIVQKLPAKMEMFYICITQRSSQQSHVATEH